MTESSAPWLDEPDYDPNLDRGEPILGESRAEIEVALPARIAGDVTDAAQLWRDRDAVAKYADEIRRGVLAGVRSIAARARAQRPEGRVTASTVAQEVSILGDAHDALEAVADAVRAGASEAKGILGDVVLEVEPERELGTASVRVGDGHGGELKVTRSQGTRVAADTDAILDVLAASLGEDPELEIAYARGVRAGFAALLALIGPPAWKTTALDELRKSLEAREEYDLAIRLGHAYGRVSNDRPPSVKLERVEPKGARS